MKSIPISREITKETNPFGGPFHFSNFVWARNYNELLWTFKKYNMNSYKESRVQIC